jgi:hypothetical protein
MSLNFLNKITISLTLCNDRNDGNSIKNSSSSISSSVDVPSVSGSVSVQPVEPFPWLTGVTEGEVGTLEEQIRYSTVSCCAVLRCTVPFDNSDHFQILFDLFHFEFNITLHHFILFYCIIV